MRKMTRAKLLGACAVFFLLGVLWGSRDLGGVLAEPTTPKPAAPPLPMETMLAANVYMQTSAEYRACCLQVYKCAELRLAALLEAARPRPANPAVVMDLDETVLDNSAFQTFLYKNKLEYSEELWDVYEEKYPQDVALVPGAKGFIDKAEALGVTVVYISNRSEVYKSSTQAALGKLGVEGKNVADRLFLKPKDGSFDKSARREAVAAKYNVLLFFGDNLRDFSDTFAARKVPKDANTEDYLQAISLRKASADEAACHWGVDWFVLPNPVYGEWEKLTGPDPRAVLRPTSMEVPKPN